MNSHASLFKEFSYQNLATQILSTSISKNHIAPAYLFTGPKGVGQKKIALRFLEGLLNKESRNSNKRNIRNRLESGNHPDCLQIEPTYLYQGKLINQSIYEKENYKSNAFAQIRLEQIKSLKSFLNKKPIEGKLSIGLLEDVDALNEAASNALLKTLEEPINGLLILISSRPEKLLSTIKSRCQVIPFKPLENRLLKDKLNQYELSENIVNSQRELIELSNGSPDLLEKILKNIEDIPAKIWSDVKSLPKEPLEALKLAKHIADSLNHEEQILLIDWMQQYYWEKEIDIMIIKRLEELKIQLKSYINQRIAWEITLLEIISK